MVTVYHYLMISIEISLLPVFMGLFAFPRISIIIIRSIPCSHWVQIMLCSYYLPFKHSKLSTAANIYCNVTHWHHWALVLENTAKWVVSIFLWALTFQCFTSYLILTIRSSSGSLPRINSRVSTDFFFFFFFWTKVSTDFEILGPSFFFLFFFFQNFSFFFSKVGPSYIGCLHVDRQTDSRGISIFS